MEALAGAGGVVTKTYRYDAFGNEENETAGDTNPFRYSGEYYDTETGNIYLRNRYYNPDNARFIQMDSYWNVKNSVYSDVVEGETLFPNISNIRQSGNLYAYCLNNPILYEDITGELAYPGQIHNLVVNMVAKTYELEKEQTIDYKNSVFWGRADLINGKTGEVWDVKPYTDDPKKHAKQEAQVQKYVNNV